MDTLFDIIHKSIEEALNSGAGRDVKTQFLGMVHESESGEQTPMVLSVTPIEDAESQHAFVQWLPALINMHENVTFLACGWGVVEPDNRGRLGCTIVIEKRLGAVESKWYPVTQRNSVFEVARIASRDASIPSFCEWGAVMDIPRQEYAHLTRGTPFYGKAVHEVFNTALAARIGLLLPVSSDDDNAAQRYTAKYMSTMSWFNMALMVSQSVHAALLKVLIKKMKKEIAAWEDMQITLGFADIKNAAPKTTVH